MTIATVREDGFPQATTVSYINDGLTIYFATSSDSQKARNIARDQRVSVTINRDYENWSEIEGLSMAAAAHSVTDAREQERVEKLMFEKFTQVADYEPDEPMDLAFVRLEPKVVSVLDYRKEFGHTELVQID